jgi:hypothetical protein
VNKRGLVQKETRNPMVIGREMLDSDSCLVQVGLEDRLAPEKLCVSKGYPCLNRTVLRAY